MLLFLVRLALALQSLDGCQDLIKLITAVSHCRGIQHPTPPSAPPTPLKTWLKEKAEKAQDPKQTGHGALENMSSPALDNLISAKTEMERKYAADMKVKLHRIDHHLVIVGEYLQFIQRSGI